MKASKQILLGSAVVLGAGAVLLAALLLRSWQGPSEGEGSAPGAARRPFAAEYNDANVAFKNGHFASVLKIVEDLERRDLSSSERYALACLSASAAKGLGLYAHASGNVEKALAIKETAFAWFLKGLILEGAGDLGGAEGAWRASLRVDSSYAPSLEKMGDLQFRRGRKEESLSFYEKGPKSLGAASETALVKAAVVKHLLGREEKSLADAERYLAKSQTGRYAALAHLVRGQSLAALSRPAEAAEAHEKAASLAPISERPLIRHAQALFLIRQGDFVKAAGLLSQIEGAENAPAARRSLAQMYYQLEDWERGLRFLDGELAFSAENPDAYYAAVCQYKMGRHAQALRLFDRVKARPVRDEYTLSSLLLSSLALAKSGRPKEAFGRIEEARRYWPDDPRVIHALAGLCMEVDPDSFATRLGPWLDRAEFPDLVLLLADWHLRQNRTKDAYAALREYLQRRSPGVRLVKTAGDLALRLRKFEEAEDWYANALSLGTAGGEKARVQANLAWCRWQRKKTDEARSLLKEALVVSPDDPGLLLNAAVMARADGDEKSFWERLEAAEREESRSRDGKLRSRIDLESGRRLAAEGRREAAGEVLRRALRFDPANSAAQALLASLAKDE